MPAGPYRPNSGLVAQGWLAQRVAGLTAGMVSSRLPREPRDWATLGFVQATVVAGAPDIDVPIRRPLVQIDCWAASVDAAGNVSEKPPTARAWRLAELIMLAVESRVQTYGQPVTMPANYDGARVNAVIARSEPSEVADDPSGYARVTLDLEFDWIRA